MGEDAADQRQNDDDEQQHQPLDIVDDVLAQEAQQAQGQADGEHHQQHSAHINGDADGVVAQQAHGGQHFILIALHPALTLDHDVLPLLVNHGLHFRAGCFPGGLRGLLVDDDIGLNDLVQQRLHHILHQAGVHPVAYDLHDIGNSHILRSLDDVAGHGVLDGVGQDGEQGGKVLPGGVEQGAQLIIPQRQQRQDLAGIFQLLRGISAGGAVILQLFAVLDSGVHLQKDLVQIGQHGIRHAVHRHVGGLYGLSGGGAQRFGGHFVHHVPGGGDGMGGHHAHGYVITRRGDGNGKQHGNDDDADHADTRAPGKQCQAHAVQRGLHLPGGALQPCPQRGCGGTVHLSAFFRSYCS